MFPKACPACFVQSLYPIKKPAATGYDHVSIDCMGSRHIMSNLCPLLSTLAVGLSSQLRRSWHSSPVGQDTISLQCKECSSIQSDLTTHEKQLSDDLSLLFPRGKASLIGKNAICFKLNFKGFVICLFFQMMKLINCNRSIKCQKMHISVRVNTSFMVDLNDKRFVSRRVTISVVAVCNGILMRTMAKTHVPTQLLLVCSKSGTIRWHSGK